MTCCDGSGEICEPMETRCDEGLLAVSSLGRLEFGWRAWGMLEEGRCCAKWESGGWRCSGSLDRLSTLRKVVIIYASLPSSR
jgi:hypothetical protein